MLRCINWISVSISLALATSASASTIFTSQPDLNAAALGAGHFPPEIYTFDMDATGALGSGTTGLTGGLSVTLSGTAAGLIDNIGTFGPNHFEGVLAATYPTTAVTFTFPTLVKGWGADFLSTDSTGPAPNNDLLVETLLSGVVQNTYSFRSLAHLTTPPGDGFFGTYEDAMFDSIRFSLLMPNGGGETWEMDRLQTFVPEPGSAAVFAMNFAVVGLILRSRTRPALG